MHQAALQLPQIKIVVPAGTFQATLWEDELGDLDDVLGIPRDRAQQGRRHGTLNFKLV